MVSVLLLPLAASAAVLPVDSEAALYEAVERAVAGDTIQLAEGRYALDRTVSLTRSGTRSEPIRIEGNGTVVLEIDALIGFRVMGAHWSLSDLELVGVCAEDHDCEHAVQVVGGAVGFSLSGSVLRNFNAQIKANGEDGVFPDEGSIRGNELYNDAPRQTDRPVVPIDVVGASDWRVEGNHIHDFAKAGGNGISYAAFFKGNGSGGHFERNLVECEGLHSGGIRLGLSLGGGGTSPDSVCRHGDCSVEHTGGVLRNNIIARCPADVGIYLNAAADTAIEFNTLWETTGIDVRFSASTAELVGNVLDAPIRERDGGVADVDESTFTTAPLDAIYRDPSDLDFYVQDPTLVWTAGADAPEVDFCGQPRGARTVLGAVDVESDCDTAFRPDGLDAPAGVSPDEPGPEDDTGGVGSVDRPGGSIPTAPSEAEGENEASRTGMWMDGGCQVSPVLPTRLHALLLLALGAICRRASTVRSV